MEPVVEIIQYADEHADAFRQLNLEWLSKYGLLESHDIEVINDPKTFIIDNGGFIFLAKSGDEIIGSSAIVRNSQGEHELMKMAVKEEWRGKGISKLLIEKCIAAAKTTGGEKIMLFSNHKLTTAIKLYEKYGFRHVDVVGSPFETADIKMELLLK